MRLAAVPMLAIAALSACSKPTGEPEAAATTEAPVASASAAETFVPVTEIPEPVRGKWGINLADCDVSRGDAKGSLEIGADSLKFYESVARLDRINAVAKRGIGAEFRFSGEGEEWTRTMQLFVSSDGKTLTREEFGPDAMEQPLTYLRCPE
ncbi:MAG: hypothetical protein KDE32_03310 [Novosphingobium sp.]|nr:hypothetical protein [Novosphingobium sp.]